MKAIKMISGESSPRLDSFQSWRIERETSPLKSDSRSEGAQQ